MNRPNKGKPRLRPAPLRPGDTVAVVAPSSPFSHDKLDELCRLIEDQGLRPILGRHLRGRNGYLAGTDADRAEDLIEAIISPAVAGILCARGGYGSSRILTRLPFDLFDRHPKIFLGFSDITFLLAAFCRRTSWTPFHGPNVIALADSPPLLHELFRFLAGRTDLKWSLAAEQVLRNGTATGPIMGGNLTCLVHLLGTPFFPVLQDSLLLIEDRGEALYRLDRMINHLKLAGQLDRISGLLIGQFVDCDNYDKIVDMVWDHVKSYDFPVVAGLPFGHAEVNHTIPMGSPFALNTYEGTLEAIGSPFQE